MNELARIDATALRAASTERVVSWLEASLEALAREAEAGASTLEPHALGSLLSPPTLRDAITTSCEVRRELHAAVAALPCRSGGVGRVALLLPANVETAVVRPLLWALLARDAVALRVSSRHPGIAPRWHALLEAADPELARAIGLVRSARDDHEAHRALAGWADRLHVWGSDATVTELARITGREVVAHGTGLSLALLDRASAARVRDVDEALARLALDVARYDQRGCLSPRALLLERGSGLEAREVAERLSAALEVVSRRLPRGALEDHEVLAQRVHRDTTIAIGAELFVGTDHSVSLERGPLRDGPSVRHLALHTLAREEIVALVERLGPHLKSVGVLDEEAVATCAAWLPTRAHLVPLGRMQTPSLLAPADGAPPWSGF